MTASLRRGQTRPRRTSGTAASSAAPAASKCESELTGCAPKSSDSDPANIDQRSIHDRRNRLLVDGLTEK